MTKIVIGSPFARHMVAQKAIIAAALAAPPAQPPKALSVPPRVKQDPPPQTQRLKMVDDAGLANINRSREERRRINARRFERAQRAEAGKSSAD